MWKYNGEGLTTRLPRGKWQKNHLKIAPLGKRHIINVHILADLEQAFNNDLAFFLKVIGSQNSSEMTWKLVDVPRTMLVDGEFLKQVNETSNRWFQSDISGLSVQSKIRLLPYIYRTMKTSIPQLARTFGLSREEITHILAPLRSRSRHRPGG